VIFDPHAVKIFTDGSCYKNPGGLSGCAAIVEYPDEWQRRAEQIVDYGVAESSINRMELLAWNRSLEWIIKESSNLSGARIQLITDSQYVHQNTARAASWRNNSWRNYDGRPLENRDLWKRFLSLRSRLRANVTFHQTKGKRSPALRAVDSAAKAAAKSGAAGTDRGFRSGKVGRPKAKLPGAASLFPAKGQVAVISPYRSVVIGKTENKIHFLCYDEAKQQHVEKYYAYAEPVNGGQLHRGHTYRVRFGSLLKYPVIEEILEEIAL
jgi:ribonuclease HI